MMIPRGLFLVALVLIYCVLFSTVDHTFQDREPQLKRALPASVQRVGFGYLSQLVSELLFVETSVFLGGLKHNISSQVRADTLAHNFKVMTSLYPEFIDPYYFAQSYLAPISHEAALCANDVISTGIRVYPNNQVLRFYQAFNYYHYLEQPLDAAAAFTEAVKLPNAPTMFEHLAAVFSARGGNLSAGLAMLNVMLAAEDEENIRMRYQDEIDFFEKALIVDRAIIAYSLKYHVSPTQLNDLVPEYLEQLPEVNDYFVLVYEPPVLSLKRPDN